MNTAPDFLGGSPKCFDRIKINENSWHFLLIIFGVNTIINFSYVDQFFVRPKLCHSINCRGCGVHKNRSKPSFVHKLPILRIEIVACQRRSLWFCTGCALWRTREGSKFEKIFRAQPRGRQPIGAKYFDGAPDFRPMRALAGRVSANLGFTGCLDRLV